MAQRFLTLEAAVELLFSLFNEEHEDASICQLPPDEDGNITDEEHVNDNDLSEVLSPDVGGHVEVMRCTDDDVDSPECTSLEPQRRRPARKTREETVVGTSAWAGKAHKASTKAGNKTSKPSNRAEWSQHSTFYKKLANQHPRPLVEEFPELANMNPFAVKQIYFSRIPWVAR